MDGKHLIATLSAEIWDKTSWQPDAKNIQLFWDKLKGVEIDDLIVCNFLTYQGTYLEDFLLSIFPLWKNLDVGKWREIFAGLEGNAAAEYYMKVIADRFLGIDPGFESTKELVTSAITFPDDVVHNASNFVPTMSGKLKEIYEKRLREHYNISLSDLTEVNKRLTQS